LLTHDSLIVLKVPLNPNQSINRLPHIFVFKLHSFFHSANSVIDFIMSVSARHVARL